MGPDALAQAERLVAAADVVDPEAVLERVWSLVDEEFLDPEFNGADWASALDRHRPAVRAARSLEEVGAAINAMVDELDTSHTRLFTPADRGYYEFLDIFRPFLGTDLETMFPDGGRPRYPGIGVVTTTIDGTTFISDVVEGSAADDAGLLVGDALVTVDGAPFTPIRSFLGKTGAAVEVVVQSTADAASRRVVDVRVDLIDPAELFLESVRASVRRVERGGHDLAYVRLRSYAGLHFQEELESIVRADLRDADGLVLDIRGGWGGASAEYLNLFNDRIPVMSMQRRGHAMRALDSQWRKPVVLLVDGGSRSGKEILAWGFKRYDIGPVVGTRTAGAVVGGSPRLLPAVSCCTWRLQTYWSMASGSKASASSRT